MNNSEVVWCGSAVMFALSGVNYLLRGNTGLGVALVGVGFLAYTPVMVRRYLG